MKLSTVKIIFLRGLALAIPLGIVGYVFIRIILIIEKIISPLATRLGIHRLLGGATLTVLAVLLILIFVFFLGLLMRIKIVSTIRKEMENTILKFVPSLNYLKLMADGKLEVDNTQETWKSGLLYFEGKYSAAFIVEESDTLITLFVSKSTSIKEGEILMANKKDISFFHASYIELHKYSRAFGKGFISLVRK